MDDTLYLERDYVRSGFLHVGAFVEQKFGVSRFFEVAWELFLQGQRKDIFNRAVRRLRLPAGESIVEELVDAYRNQSPHISMPADSVQCLERIRSTFILGLITDGPVSSQKNKARALRLHRWMSLQIFTDRWGVAFRKPHDRAFLAIQEQTGSAAGQCMYVGDNPHKDFSAPARLGWMTVRVRRLGGLHSDTDSHDDGPSHQFADLTPLSDLLGVRKRCAAMCDAG
jgi:putative hydrolase of the HAD superfamily